ncbi:MAG: NAD-dependent epimerase/dehydratase family protein [Gemmatimonadota bacterium]
MTEPPNRPTGRVALLLGATGLVGSHCLDLLLAEPSYSTVRLLGRRAIARDHSKLEQHVLDFDRFDEHPELFDVDEVFCCLGTTIRKAGSQEAFHRVDVEYPVAAARLAAEAGADQFLVVSALGADPDSRVFYNRSKGEMESLVRRMPLQAVWVLRPALLLGEREEVRLGEQVAELLMRPLTRLMRGRFRRYRPIEASTVAAAMVRVALDVGTGGILESEEIAAIGAP